MKKYVIYYKDEEIERIDIFDGEKAERIEKENLLEKYNLKENNIKENRRAEFVENEQEQKLMEFAEKYKYYESQVDVGSKVWRVLETISEELSECMGMIENEEGVRV